MNRCILIFLFIPLAASHSFPPNANHIFNAIHSSMRQWGSSLNHNGMSFFLASVPAGTQLYHGDSSSNPVKGPEWLAFEPEHAEVFAHGIPHHPIPPPGERHPPAGLQLQSQHQSVLAAPEDRGLEGGFLHTFSVTTDLRLLYIDGMSAGKTGNGTLDSQDRILFRDKLGKGGHMDEFERAEMLCRMIREVWNDRLDGAIRMEAGFEIILCDFANVELLQAARVRPRKTQSPDDEVARHVGMQWRVGVASRYHGIGGGRVSLNYDHFVTAYNYGLDLFGSVDESSSPFQPRLTHLRAEDLEPLRRDLGFLIRNHAPNEASMNWQAIADMVVHRYALRLRYLASGQLATLKGMKGMKEEAENLMTPFIDYDRRNATAEIDRCSLQFMQRSTTQVPTLAAETVLSVSRSICATLRLTLDQTDYRTAIVQIQSLMEYLAWTKWKECNGCGDHETCIIPMWPMGTVEDYNHPQCRNNSHLDEEGSRYWGGFPRGGNPPEYPES